MMQSILNVLALVCCLLALTSSPTSAEDNDHHRKALDEASSSSSSSSSVFITTNQRQQQHRRRAQNILQVPPGEVQWQECVDDLYASDANGDLQLGEVEYTLFIATRTRGEILVDQYRNLPFSLISCYVYGACFCSVFSFVPDCCVGSEAHIELDPSISPLIADNLITLCQSVDSAIQQEIGTLPPISTPIDAPTPSPSSVPVVSSDAPSFVPSSAPTIVSLDAPSAVPSLSPTIVMSSTVSPSESPTMVMTMMNSTVPSSMPVGVPSSAPSMTLIDAPSSGPSMESMMPTPDALTCVNFQYGIQNDAGFDADDIFNEVNNTLKTGLIIATENVTINVLNASFPRTDDRRWRRNRRNLNKSSQLQGHADRHLLRSKERMERYNGNTAFAIAINLMNENRGTQVQDQRRSLVYHTQSSNDDHHFSSLSTARRLVYYTDVFEPVINNIFDNAFCGAPEGFQCAVVDSTVCVMLEEGDDEDEVRATLLSGISAAIVDGSFSAAIPPEHQLPGGDEQFGK